jgi:hypothetical protein
MYINEPAADAGLKLLFSISLRPRRGVGLLGGNKPSPASSTGAAFSKQENESDLQLLHIMAGMYHLFFTSRGGRLSSSNLWWDFVPPYVAVCLLKANTRHKYVLFRLLLLSLQVEVHMEGENG